MSDHLFFIPILAKALQAPDITAGLREAFARIRERQHDPGYREGYVQWLRFLEAATESAQRGEQQVVSEAAVRMILRRVLRGDPARGPQSSQAATQSLRWETCTRAISESAMRTATLTLQIYREDDLIASLPLPPADEAIVRGIRPGRYTLTLDTGRLLWSGELSQADVLWHRAFPGRPLTLAAESAPASASFSRRIFLSVGMPEIVVLPGVETGTLRFGTDRPPT